MRKVLTLLALAGLVAGTAELRPLYADDEALQTNLAIGTDDGSGGPLPCGKGTKVKCGEITTTRCLEYVAQPNFTISSSGGGFGTTWFCVKSQVTVTYQFLDP